MEQVKIEKDKLLAIVKDNKAKHDVIYESAVDGYKVKAKEILLAKLAEVEAGNQVKDSLGIPYPESHAEDYEAVIQMLELSVDKEIVLQYHEFNQYVRNKWSWRNSFMLSNSGYVGLGSAKPKKALLATGEYVATPSNLRNF